MSQSPQPVSPTAEPTIGVVSAAVDASCRWPLLGLYFGAAIWLVLSAVAYLVASMSFHAPAMFADCAALSYGRMAPVANHLLVYGFCIPAGWAMVLWMLARLGRTRLAQGWMVMVGGKLWNLGVLVGAVAILVGGGSGFELVEFPIYAAWLLLPGSLLVGIAGLSTLRNRAERGMHPVQWFGGLSVFWFPWIYITAVAFLQLWPVRGMAQGAVHWWYLAQLQVVLLGLFGVASLFYFLPLFKEKPLRSWQLALFALITLIFCGGLTGIPMTAPVPAWLSVLSRIMSVFLVLPVLAVALNVWLLQSGPGTVELRYFRFGLRAALVWMAFILFTRGTPLWRTISFTLVEPGLFQLFVQGFTVMIALGAAYHILPRIAGTGLRFPRLVKVHFALTAAGVLLVVIPFVIGGFQQGAKLVDARVPFTEVAAGTLMPIRVASTGQLILILGHALLGVNVVGLMVRLGRQAWKSFDNAPVGLAGAMEGGA